MPDNVKLFLKNLLDNGSKHLRPYFRSFQSVFSHHPLTPELLFSAIRLQVKFPRPVSNLMFVLSAYQTNHTKFPKWFVCFVYLTTCLTAVNIALPGHDKISVMNLLPNCQITYTIIYQGKMKKSSFFSTFFSYINYQKTYTIIYYNIL